MHLQHLLALLHLLLRYPITRTIRLDAGKVLGIVILKLHLLSYLGYVNLEGSFKEGVFP